MSERGPRAGSASTDRSLDVLEALISAGAPITLTELARKSGVPLATCSAIAASLEARGFAKREVVSRSHLWRPTLKMYVLGMRTLQQGNLSDDSQPILNQLRDQLDLHTHLGVLDGGRVVYVAKAATSAMVQFNTYPGRIAPYNQTALGKAIAAFSPERRLEEMIAQAVPGAGPNAAHSTQQRLRDDLKTIREQGFAVEDQEEEAGIACIAAPVLDSNGHAAAAIGATGLEHQLLHERRPTITQAVIHAAETLARRTGLRES